MGLTDDYVYSLYEKVQRVDIHDKYIYYLVGDCSGLDKYKLTIENCELKEVKTNTYSEKQIIAAGGC